ncbi:MAG: hypothetical protein AAB657_00710 [Patescibacteria group bacterium]
MNKKIILVVCSGNMFRSPIGAFCLNRVLVREGLNDTIEATSRGIQGLGGTIPPKGKNLMDYPLEWSNSQNEFIRSGIDINNHRASIITEDALNNAALILAMDWSILYSRSNSLLKLFPAHSWKMRLFSELNGLISNIEDPFGQVELISYTRVIQLIDNITQHSTAYIKQWMANIQN